MDQAQFLNWLTRLVGQILLRLPADDREEATSEIAQACWDGLLVLLRELFLSRTEISLEGLGYFSRQGEEWSFTPSAALSEVEALQATPEAGAELLASRALSLLRQAEATLQLVPADLEIAVSRVLGPDEKILRAIFGEQLTSRTPLTGEIEHAEVRLREIRRRLLGAEWERANQMIEERPSEAPELGKVYTGTVKRVEPYGAFVEILPGTVGLVHIGELAPVPRDRAARRARKVSDIAAVGDEMPVQVISIEPTGQVLLSRRAAIREAADHDAAHHERTDSSAHEKV